MIVYAILFIVDSTLSMVILITLISDVYSEK